MFHLHSKSSSGSLCPKIFFNKFCVRLGEEKNIALVSRCTVTVSPESAYKLEASQWNSTEKLVVIASLNHVAVPDPLLNPKIFSKSKIK